MREYLSDAVVLSREPSGEFDLRISLFTERFGKLVGFAKSARKIASKLASHLEEGNLARVRVVEKNGFQIVDALKNGKLDIGTRELEALNRLLHDGEADAALWAMIASGGVCWRKTLRLLGWDPEEANCSVCGGPARQSRGAGGKAEVFSLARQDFFCRSCVPRAKADELIYI